MSNYQLPVPVAQYFSAKEEANADLSTSCFADDAIVWDNGEDIVLHGVKQIQKWISGTVRGYELSSEVISAEESGAEYVAEVVVTGNFPGSPYKFENKFKLIGGKIAELVINPIGSLAQ